MAHDPLNEQEKEYIREFLQKLEWVNAVQKACLLEEFSWNQRLAVEALKPSTDDPVIRLCKQAEYAARAVQAKDMIQMLHRKAV